MKMHFWGPVDILGGGGGTSGDIKKTDSRGGGGATGNAWIEYTKHNSENYIKCKALYYY